MSCSLGGVLAKELLARGLGSEPGSAGGRIVAATTGLVTYSTPHAGSWLADWGWRLRCVLCRRPLVDVLPFDDGSGMTDFLLLPGPRIALLLQKRLSKVDMLRCHVVCCLMLPDAAMQPAMQALELTGKAPITR